MTLLHPIWLLLLVPLGVCVWMWKLPTSIRVLRSLVFFLVVCALCELMLKAGSGAGTLVVIADRSQSMPADSEILQKELVELVHTTMPRQDSLAVISYGKHTAVERMPQTGKFAGFVAEVGRDASNLAAALEMALALLPSGSPGRILLLSDGKWTGRNPLDVTGKAVAAGVSIDYRPIVRSTAGDLAIDQLEAPDSVTPGESYMLTARIHSPVSQEATVELWQGKRCLASAKKLLAAGTSHLTFRDKAQEPGSYGYTLKVTGNAKDPIPENNTARLLLGVRGQKSLLCATALPDSGLVKLLQQGGITLKRLDAGASSWSVEELAHYAAVLLENVPAEKLGNHGMENLASWVKETGSGLFMTGGKNSYGPGGYFKSPLEASMPVSMELRREHRKLALAIAVVMDRSGSMGATVPGGRTKMDLANLATVQVLEMLSGMDEFGVIAVDSSAHTIVPLGAPSAQAKDLILRIESMGGGIFIYVALLTAAQMLNRAQAGTRHIVLFADAADSEEPGEYQKLLEKCRQANMTVSVIGLGKPTDCDANLLRDIAKRGDGRCFFTEDPEQLPRLFAQDTFVVARSTFLEQVTPVQVTPAMVSLTGKRFQPLPLGGYNLCYPRPGASIAAISGDEYRAPLLASWQFGLGRVICYTGEADGAYTGPIAKWQENGEFFTSLARWAIGDPGNLPDGMLITQEIREGACLIEVHLDPERKEEGLAELPRVTTLRGIAGMKPTTQESQMVWQSADTLALTVPMYESETALSTVHLPGLGKITLAPTCLPYSPEFKSRELDDGLATMENLAKATGGKERVSLADIWKEMPRELRFVSLSPFLLGLAVLLLLLEVLERRTGFLAPCLRLGWRKLANVPSQVVQIAAGEDKKTTRPAKSTPPRKTDVSTPSAKAVEAMPQQGQPDTPPASPPVEMADALSSAKQRAQNRTSRGKH